MSAGTGRFLSSTTRTSVPGSARPSVENTFSCGSLLRVMVRPAFSVMPQQDSTSRFISAFARCTSTRGIGAPAHTQVRSVRLTRARSSSGRLTMSDTNGVDPMLKVTPSRSIIGAASLADQASSATVVVFSMIGISMP